MGLERTGENVKKGNVSSEKSQRPAENVKKSQEPGPAVTKPAGQCEKTSLRRQKITGL